MLNLPSELSPLTSITRRHIIFKDKCETIGRFCNSVNHYVINKTNSIITYMYLLLYIPTVLSILHVYYFRVPQLL